GADGDGFRGGDLVVFPLLHKSQRHGIPLLRIEKLHPLIEFGGWCEWILIGRGEQLHDVSEVHGWHLACSLGEMAARGVARDFEKPSPKQPVIPKLAGLAVNRKHDFLRQVLSYAVFMTAPSKECNKLWREDTEQGVEGL